MVIGLTTVLAASVVTAVGTSRLVTDLVASKDQASLQSIEDAVLDRISRVDAVVGRASRVAVVNRDPSRLREQLRAAYLSSKDDIARLIIVDSEMNVLASEPTATPGVSIEAQQAASAALRGAPRLSYGAASAGINSLWVSDVVVSRSGSPVVVLALIDTTFLRDMVSQAAVDGRSAYVLHQDSVLFSAGSGPVDFASALWSDTGNGHGTVDVAPASGSNVTGLYDDIGGLAQAKWRLVILEPPALVLRNTLATLVPATFVLLLGGLVGIATSWLAARRLVAPLRLLESAALRAASGAYVKPIETSRTDEVGQVASAFNAVALRLNALHDLSQLLASSSQLDQVLDGILSAMGHIVGPGVAAIYLLDEGGRWLVPVRARGADIALAPAIDSTGDTWIAHALDETGPSVFSGGARSLAEELPGLVLDETSALVAPLVSGNETLGVVVALRDSLDDVSDAVIEMARTFSAQAAVAVHNSRLFAFEIESRRVAEGLRIVAEQLVRPGGLLEALTGVETTIAELFGAERASFAIVDRRALGLPPAIDHDTEGEMIGFAMRILGGSGVQRPAVIRAGDDASADAYMARTGSKELLVVPIGLESDHGAVIVISLAGRSASPRDLELADALADEIELSLDNAYNFERALERANSLETVFHISQAVGSSLEVKVVLDRVLDVVQKILSADAVALMTYDARRKTISTEMARGNVSASIVERVFRPGDDVVGYVFASGQPVALRDLHEGMEGIAGDAARHGLRSLLAVPLLARSRSIGVLTAFSTMEGAFSDNDLSMLRTFASQAALAIDTARLYSREHEVASILQHSILPGVLPTFEDIDAASAYEPAGGDAEIGGDYYDLFRSPDGSICVAISDVCGKGVVAATKTSMIKYAVRSLVAAGFTPGRVLTEVNRMVGEGGDPTDIVTMWVGSIDPANRTVTWSGGGHPPGLLLRASNGEIVRLISKGPLLGAVSDVMYLDEIAVLEPGDAILLYTDGVTEARSGNTFFGEERVGQALCPGGTSAEIVERLMTAVRRFAQRVLRDDVAVLAVRFVPKDEANVAWAGEGI